MAAAIDWLRGHGSRGPAAWRAPRPFRVCVLPALVLGAWLVGCGASPTRSGSASGTPLSSADAAPVPGAPLSSVDPAPALWELGLPPAMGEEANGEDEGRHSGAEALAVLAQAGSARFVALPAPPASAHPLVCDLTTWGDALYVSHAVKPLDRTGARVHRFLTGPRGQLLRGSWQLVFDWDRGGAPESEWARGGEGFTRLRRIDGRLLVPDADSPGPESFGVTDAWVENLVLASDRAGVFPALEPLPAGALIQPWAYHALDVSRFQGKIVVSGGAVNPGPGSRFPAAFWVADPGASVLGLAHLFLQGNGVVRTTYLHRFRGRLYSGLQNNERRLRVDVAVLSDLGAAPAVARISETGGYLTRAWASNDRELFWLGERYRSGEAGVFHSRDGLRFERVALPPGVGAPQDLVLASDGTAVLLTRAALLTRRAGRERFELLATTPESDPFGEYNAFCGARLGLLAGRLVAGSLRDGGLYLVEPG